MSLTDQLQPRNLPKILQNQEQDKTQSLIEIRDVVIAPPEKKKKGKQVTLYLNSELIEEVKKIAKKLGYPINHIYHIALEEYFVKTNKK